MRSTYRTTHCNIEMSHKIIFQLKEGDKWWCYKMSLNSNLIHPACLREEWGNKPYRTRLSMISSFVQKEGLDGRAMYILGMFFKGKPWTTPTFLLSTRTKVHHYEPFLIAVMENKTEWCNFHSGYGSYHRVFQAPQF